MNVVVFTFSANRGLGARWLVEHSKQAHCEEEDEPQTELQLLVDNTGRSVYDAVG